MNKKVTHKKQMGQIKMVLTFNKHTGWNIYTTSVKVSLCMLFILLIKKREPPENLLIYFSKKEMLEGFNFLLKKGAYRRFSHFKKE